MMAGKPVLSMKDVQTISVKNNISCIMNISSLYLQLIIHNDENNSHFKTGYRITPGNFC
jgi:hypothetical protein